MANSATAIYFDGSGDFLTFPSSPDLNFTTSEAWVFEAWICLDSGGGANPVIYNAFGTDDDGNSGGDHYLFFNTSLLKIYWGGVGIPSGTEWNSGALMRPVGTWGHFAFQYSGKTASIYIDGVLDKFAPSAVSTITATSGSFKIGDNSNINFFKGWMDAIRVSKVARYGNIDAPTTQLKTWQTAGRGKNTLLPHHTKLLIQANTTTTTSSTIIDETGRHTITATNAAHSQGKTNFGNTAIYFDGSGDYLDIASHADFAILRQDFSAECWYYRGGTSPTNQWIFSGRDTNHFDLALYGTNRIDMFYEGGYLSTGTTVDTTGGWMHLAMGRSNNVVCIWLNGKLVASEDGGTVSIAQTGMYIGRQHTSTTTEALNGYLDGIRVCVGQSAYTPNFVPYGGQKNVAVTRGGAVTDARHPSANTHAIRMGQAAMGSTAATNANTYHLHFDGTADYLIHNTSDWRTADDRGTVFAWVYFDDLAGSQVIFSKADTADTGEYWLIQMSASGKLHVDDTADGTSNEVLSSSTHFSATTWHSVAVVSTGSAYTFYVDGTARSTSGTNDGGWINGMTDSDNVSIGALNYSSSVSKFDGRIMQVAYWGGSSGTTGVLDADAIAALHAAGKGYDMTADTGNYDSWTDDLKGYWRMGNHYLDTAETIYDASGYGADMHSISAPNANTATGTNDTTFIPNWQDRGFFSGDKYTSLLIQSSSREGAITFEDSGPGFKKITFDGTDDRAHKTSLTNYRSSDTVGSIVAWIKVAAAKDNNAIFCYGDTAAGSNYFYWSINSDGRLTFQPVVSASSLGGQIYAGVSSVPVGAWSMVALTYDDTSYKMYVDGSEVSYTNALTGSGTATETWFNDLGSGVFDAICVGALLRNTDVHEFDGQIAGVGVWSSTLTATQLTAMNDLGPGGNWKTSYSSGLVDYWTFGNQIGEGTDTSSTIYSQVASGNDLTTSGTMAAPFAGHTITASGGPYHSTVTSAFGGSSIYFDGTDGKLTVPASADWAYGTRDFTIDLWMYSTDTTRYGGLFCNADGTGNTTEYLRLSHMSTAYIEFRMRNTTQGSNDNEVNVSSTSGQIKNSTWYHIAAQRRNGQMELYVDGVFQGSAASTHNHTWGNSEGIELGVRREFQWFQGYMDEIRFTTGITRYSPSIERYANTFVEKGDTGDAFTYLQLNSNGVKNGTGFSDGVNRTGFGTTAMTVGAGNPTWRNTKGDPYGGANTALHFDGGSYLTIADNSNHDFAAADDATFECWVNFDDVSGTKVLFGCGGEGNSGNPDGWGLRYNTGTSYSTHGFYMNLDWASPYTVAATGPADNEFKEAYRWYHCAVTKKGTNWSLYTDGVFKSSMTYSPAVNTATAFRLGYAHDSHAAHSFKGYIDGFRISRGIVRYGGASLRTTQQVVTSSNSDTQVVTSNSTFGTGEATIPFSSDAYTALYFNGDETFTSGAPGVFTATKSASLGANTGTELTLTQASAIDRRQGVSAFGANSYYFSGTGAKRLTAASHDDWILGTGGRDWCIETWIRPTSTSGNQCIFGHGTGAGPHNRWYYAFYGTSSGASHQQKIAFDYYESGTAVIQNNTDPFVINFDEWQHIAVTHSGDTYTHFHNGKMVHSFMDTTDVTASTANTLNIGTNTASSGAEDPFYGYMDSARISLGTTRYNYSGTNIKAGLNAVHHSHCKLLITSNTFNGNTHFDDFSDQGNYWGQTPYSYNFNGTSQYLLYTGDDPYGTGSDQPSRGSIVMWIKRHLQSGQSANFTVSKNGSPNDFLFMYIDGTNSENGRWGFHAETPSGTAGYETTRAMDTEGLTDDNEWHQIAWVVDGTGTGTSGQKFYIDGKDAGIASLWTDTIGGTEFINMVADDTNRLAIGALVRASAGYYTKEEFAQVGVWGSTTGSVGVLSDANIQAMWEAGPTANWTTDYSAGMLNYWAMGNHNTLGNKPADNATTCYDRVGNKDLTTNGSMSAPHKGTLIVPTAVTHSTDLKNFGSSAISFKSASNSLLTISQNPSGAYNQFRFTDATVEYWIYPNGVSAGYEGIFSLWATNTAGDTAVNAEKFQVVYNSNSITVYHNNSAWTDTGLDKNFGHWDHHAWVTDVAGSRLNFYVNGILRYSHPLTSPFGGGQLLIGAVVGSSAELQGYMDEFAMYSVAKYNSVAFPGKATQTPSYLSDPSGNHFTTTGLAETDQMLDTPENNFATLNPLHATEYLTFSEGNLKIVSSAANWGTVAGTFGVSSGKWYWEVKMTSNLSHNRMGILESLNAGNFQLHNTSHALGTNSLEYAYRVGDGSTYNGGTQTAGYGDTFVDGDIGGVGLDMDAGTLTFYRNGVSQGIAYSSIPAGQWLPAHSVHESPEAGHYNFGQGDPDGENNFTDSNGRGGFRFEPPSGFLSLCTANMKDADYAPLGPNSVTGNPDQHFDTVLWTGNALGNRRIGGLNFQPDLVWTKQRSGAINNYLHDILRGTTKKLITDVNNAEAITATGLTEFNSDGFTVGSSSEHNQSGHHYVAWCWKAGNGSVENSDGTIASTVSVNKDAGFSIVSWEGNAVIPSTIGHGLDKAPEFRFQKNRETTDHWAVYHKSTLATHYLHLNSTAAAVDNVNRWYDTEPTSKVFTVTNDGEVNGAGQEMISYCWHSVEGFSKFGSYKGNSSADGPFVYLGFKPALVIVKISTGVERWYMWDNKRNPTNPVYKYQMADDAGAEGASYTGGILDFVSNGFKLREATSIYWNNSSHTYIYAAWAEIPFKYANAR